MSADAAQAITSFIDRLTIPARGTTLHALPKRGEGGVFLAAE